jgi:DeoR family transcriptional regulator of aga operon
VKKELRMSALTERRRALILDELNRSHSIRVAGLSTRLGVSAVSIRRDFKHLEEMGALKRVHGGAVLIRNGAGNTGATPSSTMARFDQKRRIARAAAALVNAGDCVILDSGTTALQVAAQLPEDLLQAGKLSVITASLPVVHQLGAQRGLHLIVLGGVFLPEYQVMVGPQTLDALRGLHADKMFLGTDGLTFSQGITTSNVLEAEVDRAMVRAASQIIVVADSSKIGGIGLTSIMPLSEIHALITDCDAPAEFVMQLRDAGVKVILV